MVSVVMCWFLIYRAPLGIYVSMESGDQVWLVFKAYKNVDISLMIILLYSLAILYLALLSLRGFLTFWGKNLMSKIFVVGVITLFLFITWILLGLKVVEYL